MVMSIGILDISTGSRNQEKEMANEPERHTALSDVAARQLANATKTPPQMKRITPRWLTHLLQWVPVQAGIYRLNRVKDESNVIVCQCRHKTPAILPVLPISAAVCLGGDA